MRTRAPRLSCVLKRLAGLLIILGLSACGDSSGEQDAALRPTNEFTLPGVRTVVGIVDVDSGVQRAIASNTAVVRQIPPGTTVSLDDQTSRVSVDPDDGHFQIMDIDDGDHSLFVHLATDERLEVPFRMLNGGGLHLGTLKIRNRRVERITGFDGYRFGFVDEDQDGMNDLCVDANGNGICDEGVLYAGYAYVMSGGYIDADGDGVNDRFADADGDGINDRTGMPYGHGFGWIDADGDGVNDAFVDADGDGICDLMGTPFRHPFGYMDADGDGVNDRFADADGDGINDRTGMPYMAMPGWVDVDGDGVNDFYRDADGDGINDMTGMPYGHGFGWVDADGDGVNDAFVDADGDGINDITRMPYGHGFAMAHMDTDGNGIDDVTGVPYRHGFGWIDADGDGVNDAFVDADGDGVNDHTGHSYIMGFQHGNVDMGDHGHPPVEWPMEPPDTPGRGRVRHQPQANFVAHQ